MEVKGSNRILYVRNFPFETSGEDLYDLFGKYGQIRQIRIGNTEKTRSTAFVVFENLRSAISARSDLNGYKIGKRYLSISYFSISNNEQNS